MTTDRRGFLWVAVICFVIAWILGSALFGAQVVTSPDGEWTFDTVSGEWKRATDSSDSVIWGDWPKWDWKNTFLTDNGHVCKVHDLIEASGFLREYFDNPRGGYSVFALERWEKLLTECEKVVGVVR